jgi:hypothetical protein
MPPWAGLALQAVGFPPIDDGLRGRRPHLSSQLAVALHGHFLRK